MASLEQDWQQQVIVRAWKDETFQKQLLENPKATIETLGVEISEKIDIQVLQESSERVYIVLPHQPSVNTEHQLSNEELEVVAGGRQDNGKTSIPTNPPTTACCWG